MEEDPVSKITFEKVADFKFKAAYEAYSSLFDEADDKEERMMLNSTISHLFDEEISYPRFYGEINRFREGAGGGRRFGRVRVKGQRKWAYRRDQQEKNRNKRHKR